MIPRPAFESFGIVEIINPPQGYASWPVDDQCRIQTDGCGAYGLVASVTAVHGRINGGPELEGTTYGRTWRIDGLGNAGTNCTNLLEVKIKYFPTLAGGETWSDWTPREFVGVGSSACYSYCVDPLDRMAHPAGDLLSCSFPRFYRLTLLGHIGDGKERIPTEYGGLLQKTSVYLSYDAHGSTPYEAVWRDISLPETLGKWTLRVWSRSRRLFSELVYYRLTEKEVSPPVLFRSQEWRPGGQNLLRGECVDCGGGLRDALVQLEPA